MNKEHILQEIKRTAQANGGVPLGWRKFVKETGIREADWLGTHWARWSDALREAGCTPNQMNTAYDESFVFEKFIALARELKKLPVRGDFLYKTRRDSTFPNAKTFAKFGSKAELVKSVKEYCQNREGYEDIVLLCEGYVSHVNHDSETVDPSDGEMGFVYLMKSGRSYKIGRTNSAGRRKYELGIQLPDPLKTVHVISTDDPIGIETYWHNRFAAKRKNGEWFELDAADVNAFKRRKSFM
ncbi:MAG TPA: GIY-YIG nuclease family protein [Candidatus Dormibacteraeota bacterium]|nr:GIY-YIG nuclease family protein [Candidatus Dormibacteraeota bacterium]